MCGICGIVDLRSRRDPDRARIEAMNELLAHRGPDGGDVYCAPGIGLGHRRLAIIDLAGGTQPLFNETGTVAVTFNGEIYNFSELVTQLTATGHQFRTRSDTEVIVHAWEEWGEACVEHFDGMFAFAIWDARTETVFLARDRFGKKPLHYAVTPSGHLVFASELGALLAALPVTPQLDPTAVEDYFAFGYVPDPKTIYRGIHKLAPAHRLALRRGRSSADPRPEAYWDLTFRPSGRPSEAEAVEELRALLRQAIETRLVSDVPLGAFLSGGVDSSAVVAFMARASERPVRTCSMGFPDRRLDETRYAAMVAERYGTDHRSETVEVDALSLVDRLAIAYSEPFADSSAVPTYLVSQLARRHVTVALSGDGGDEIFAGYRRYPLHQREEQLKRLLPNSVRGPLFGALAARYPKLDWAPRYVRAKATFEALATDSVRGYFRAVTLMPTVNRKRLYSGTFRAMLGEYEAVEVLLTHARRADTDDPVARAQYIDMKTWLPGGMLTKVDRASMAHGLEVRCPLLDHRLAEWAATLPTDYRLRGLGGKWILKKALEPLLPREILYRPKQGFTMPLADWLRTGALSQKLQELTNRSTLIDSGVFERAALRRLADEHKSGRLNHGRTLWSLIMFDAFLRHTTASRSNAPATAAA